MKYTLKRNEDVRIAKGDIPWWIIAEQLDVHENTMMQWMRTELLPLKKKCVMDAIEKVKERLHEYS